MPPKRKCFGYIRVSTQRQAAEDRTSLATQEEAMAAHAKARGWELMGVRREAKSGGKTIAQRPQLAATIAEATAAKGVLVFYDLSRFSRSFIDAVNIIEELKTNGAGVSSCTESIDTSDDSPSAELTYHILLACAHYQRRLIGAKTALALKYLKRTKGYCVQGVQPPGFRYDKETGERVEIPAERRIVDRVLALREKYPDKTLAFLAERLNKRGVNTPTGLRKGHQGVWHPEMVRRILMRAEA